MHNKINFLMTKEILALILLKAIIPLNNAGFSARGAESLQWIGYLTWELQQNNVHLQQPKQYIY